MLALLALMSLALGTSSFLAGILPLSFVFSKNHLDRLSALGTGLLLGTALGVIIPEGVETVLSTSKADSSGRFPTSQIALSLLSGFTFILVIEQLVSPGSHSHTSDLVLHSVKGDTRQEQSDVEFEAGLGELEREDYHTASPQASALLPEGATPTTNRAFPLTVGLFVHGLADGLALGASALAPDGPHAPSNLSFIVFLALIIHKAPTSLALTTSLMTTSLPRAKCKKYLAIFSSATPLGAMASYMLFSFFGQGDSGWTGTSLLISGGSFLYVATVLQPISDRPTSSMATSELRPRIRVLHVVSGMSIPFLLNSVLGHRH